VIVDKIYVVAGIKSNHRFLEIRLPPDRDMLMAARGFDQMAASREREMIPGHQHDLPLYLVSGGLANSE
jgi:hypothetical protein